MAKKLTKKATKTLKNMATKTTKVATKGGMITVKNAEGDADTTAIILVQNKINYTPKVSVIIPVYNVEQYLCECLDSVCNQTLKEIEIICVDDGSTDSSLEILKEYAKKDNRITVIAQENLHAGVARNAGLAVAKGETIHFLDSDDFIDNTFYATLFKNLESYNADFAYCSWTMKTENDLAPRDMGNTEVQFLGLHTFDNDKNKVNIEVWNKLFRRSIIEEYNIRFPKSNYGEDVAFVMQYLFLSKNCFGINDPMYIYRVQPNSMMSSILNKKLDSYKAISYVLSFLNKHSELKNDNSFYFKKLENSLKWLGCLSGTPQEALNYIHSFKDYVVDKIDTSNIPSGTLLEKLKNEKYQFVFDTLFPEFRDYKKNKKYYDLQYTGTLDKKTNKKSGRINNTVDIAFIMDADYFLCSYIAITSMIKSKNKTTCYNINVIHTNLSLRQIKILSLLENSDVHINIIGFNASKYNCVKKLMHITNTALIKFDIPNIFPNLDKILYIDGDILVQKDLSDLFNINLQENYIAASKEMQASLWRYERIVGSQYYINSGVLLFNLKKMRADNVPQKMIDKKMNQPDTWKCMDQDVFNNICDRKIHFLDVAYNCTISIFLKRGWTIQEINKFYGTKYRSIEDLIKKSTILHFAGDYKPWEYNVKAGKITKKYMDVLNHSLMKYKISDYKNLKQVVTLERGLRYKRELLQWYEKVTGNKVDLNNPKTFNEKIQWSKLYDSTPIKTLLADKFLVRDWVSKKIGEEYLIPLLGVYDSFDEIDFDKLPDQFVIKTNHASGTNIIVKDKSKLDLATIKAKLDKWMAIDFAFVAGCELHYRDIPRKIIIEKYMDDGSGDLQDYKVMCFGGKPEFIWVDTDRHSNHKRNFFDLNWKEMDIKMPPLYGKKKDIPAPQTLQQMIKFAKILSAGFNMVRVDFYEIQGKVYFGEMTFTSSSGTEQVVPASFDIYLGSLFKLPKKAYDVDTGFYYKLPKQPKVKSQSIKPYILFPYYLACCIYLKYIKLPIFKFIKHTRAIIYSHSHRGKTDLLNKNFRQIMDIVQMFRDETNRRIDLLKNQQNDNNKRVENAVVDTKNQINNQQKLFESKILETNKKIDVIQNNITSDNKELSDKVLKIKDDLNNINSDVENIIDARYDDLSSLMQNNLNNVSNNLVNKIQDTSNQNAKVIDAKYQELAKTISNNALAQNADSQRIENAVVDTKNQIQTLEKTSDDIIKKLDSDKAELNKNIEQDRVMYFNPFSTNVTMERGLCDMTSAPDFENRFKKLISGLKQNDAATIVKIIRRLQMIKGTNYKLDLFTKEEKDLLQRVRDFDKEILKVSDNLYAYKNYLLPINHFEASVFLYNHGIEKLNSVENFKDKDILDIGGFIGDSVLMLSPLTNKKIYSFEAMKENFDLMQKTIELNGIKNAVPVHVAVGDKPGEIEIRFNGSASSQNDIMVKNPKYIEKCQVIKMDDYVREHNINVGLIKVDIEGAEQSFLRGAKETICKYKPTLLISIYHNVDDFLDIKPLIESWNLGYKFKIFKPVIESVSGETLLICEQ